MPAMRGCLKTDLEVAAGKKKVSKWEKMQAKPHEQKKTKTQ